MMVNKIVANKYYIYTKPQEKLISWDIYEVNPQNCGFVAYFGKVFQVIEKNLQKTGLTFYVTMSEINELPSYGDNVVVFILGDELCRIPKYTHKVGAVFKCYGTNQILGCNPFLNPSYLNLVTTIKFLKNWAIRLPEMVNYKFHKFKNSRLGKRKITPIFDIPLGYFNSEDLPIKNMQERLYDVFFAGSVVHTHYPIWSLQFWLRTPKTIARENMLSALNNFKKKHPELKVEISLTQSFGTASASAEAISYNQKMMNSKICLAPRGTSFETYRFFEAIKYGCIAITEALPQRWFYKNSPAIQMKDWQHLEAVLENLLQNQAYMERMHQKSLHWWKTKCSETVVGEYISKELNHLFYR
ncbi:glycosyltransferase family 1 protein [Nostoc sp. UHCC 0870]|uniref:glycosyltransferase family 1 protein n=1 Tax=Nostoc sp. UHCC 0870 TaxID=2914041 RepID=UPI001EDCE679|nr:glycosyltransferase family 1 protein [Nostoc sp. UHCC 0870]UKP00569.1 glycosyltransferase family 1 protein [Nostoc sp. UHCC 0870]